MPNPDDLLDKLPPKGVLETIYDVALDPQRYDELSEAWEARLWPQIADGGAAALETRVHSHF